MQKIDFNYNRGTGATQNIVIVAPEGIPGFDLVRAAKEAGYSTILATAEPADRYQNLMSYLSIEMCEKRGLCDFIIREDEPQHLLERLTKFQIAAVIPGSEIAVNYSDKIASALGVPCNNPVTAYVRRNKMAMKEAMKRAGLRHAEGAVFAHFPDALSYVNNNLHYPIVVKPVAGAGGQGVFVCNNQDEFEKRFQCIKRTPDAYLRTNESVLIEECLEGTEYAVNLFCIPGRVVVTSIFKYEKFMTSFGSYLFKNLILQDLQDPSFDELKEYAIAFSKAVDIKIGSAHSEIRMTDRGPIGHEIGARVMGMGYENFSTSWINFDESEKNIEVFTQGTAELSQRIEQHHFITCVVLSNFVQGKLKAIHGLEEIRKLNSYYCEELLRKPGDAVTYTTDLDSVDFFIWLRNVDQVQLRKDSDQVHKLFSLEVEGSCAERKSSVPPFR